MRHPDHVQERVERIVRDETRQALLGVGPTVRCHGCGDEFATDDAFSGRDPATDQRVYFCHSCNREEES